MHLLSVNESQYTTYALLDFDVFQSLTAKNVIFHEADDALRIFL